MGIGLSRRRDNKNIVNNKNDSIVNDSKNSLINPLKRQRPRLNLPDFKSNDFKEIDYSTEVVSSEAFSDLQQILRHRSETHKNILKLKNWKTLQSQDEYCTIIGHYLQYRVYPLNKLCIK